MTAEPEERPVGEQEVKYRTWACEKLISMVESEKARRQGLVNRALLQSAGLATLYGVLVKVAGPTDMWSTSWILYALGFLGTLVCFAFVFLATRIREYEQISPRQFVDSRVLDCEVDARLEVIGDSLEDRLGENRKAIGRVALWTRHAQVTALISAMLLVSGIAFSLPFQETSSP